MRHAIAALALLVAATGASAAPPTTESIDALLTVTKVQRLLEATTVNVEQAMRQAMASRVEGQPLTPEQKRVLDAAPAKFARVLREELSWDRMRPLQIQIYQESFTQEEVDGLLAFYRSPAGAAFVEKMPLVMQKSMTLMNARMGPMMEKMKAAMQEAIEEAKTAR